MLYSIFMESAGPLQSDRWEDSDLARMVLSSPPGQARDAEDELYRRLAPRVRLYGLRHLRDEQAAADLTHQVLLITIETLRERRLREPDRIVSFVLGTSRLVVRDWRRGAIRQERHLQEFGRSVPVMTTFETPELDHRQLSSCLQRLHERERSVLIMTFYAEGTTGEVADQLGLSAENVRVIRHRALGKVRECMTGGRETS
ncbi:MAG TPA: sigma-70 family RNA polymerase sigma factor [Terriglobia bacterium]|nr:sigma-70 family RNA polymerase sigma factor [Terriglobia bacterium]